MLNLDKLNKEAKMDKVERKATNGKVKKADIDKEKTKNISITLQIKNIEKLDKKVKEYNKSNFPKINRSQLINMLIDKYL